MLIILIQENPLKNLIFGLLLIRLPLEWLVTDHEIMFDKLLQCIASHYNNYFAGCYLRCTLMTEFVDSFNSTRDSYHR